MVAERDNQRVTKERTSALISLANARIWASEGWQVSITDGDGKELDSASFENWLTPVDSSPLQPVNSSPIQHEGDLSAETEHAAEAAYENEESYENDESEEIYEDDESYEDPDSSESPYDDRDFSEADSNLT